MGSNKGFNVSVIRVLQRDKNEESSEEVFEEIKPGRLSSLTKDNNLKAQKYPKLDKPKKSTPRQIIFISHKPNPIYMFLLSLFLWRVL